MSPIFSSIIDAAALPYASVSRYAHHFTRSKLRYDPVFHALLKNGLLPDQGRLLDLGCGLGVLPALLHAACNHYRAGNWPHGWPAPPQNLYLHGIELLDWKVAAASKALGNKANIQQGDIRTVEFPACAGVIILDVLMYVPATDQRQILQRITHALQPGGVLLLREANASGGWRFHITRLAEQILGLWRGQGWQKLYYRSVAEWVALLEQSGFFVECMPMSRGTPFANVLFRATLMG